MNEPTLPARDPRWASVKKLAWMRVGAIGDLLVGTASLAQMRQLFPEAEVTVLGPRLWLELLSPAAFPFVRHLITLERKSSIGQVHEVVDGKWIARGQASALSVLLASYDAFVNTNIDSLRYGFTALRAGVPVRVGSAPAPMAWLYTHNSPNFGKDPLIHERDIALLIGELATPCWKRILRTTSRNRKRLTKWMDLSPSIREWHNKGLPQLKLLSLTRATALVGRPAGRYVLVNPTASRREKTWPTDLLRDLLLDTREELASLGLEAIIIGAPNETEWLREVAGDDFHIVQPINLTDLQDVVYGARCLLTNGSSMQFIAGTTQTPVLTIFGRGQPLIWGPVGPRDRFVRARFENSNAGSTFAGFETETATYRSITIADVRAPFLAMATLESASGKR